MRTSRIFILLILLLSFALLISCSKYPTQSDSKMNDAAQIQGNGSGGNDNGGGKGGGHDDGSVGEDDADSDRPPWAGDPSVNPHIGQNPNSGIKKGGEYGDLYILLRDSNGEPELDSEGRVQPIAFEYDGINSEGEPNIVYDSEGLPVEHSSQSTIEYNAEGDLIIGDYTIGDNYAPCNVELGRINLVRSPSAVLGNGLDEAIKTLTAANVIDIVPDFCGRLTAVYEEVDGNGDHLFKTIDSPRENLALYYELMKDDGLPTSLSFLANYESLGNEFEIAASCFAAGSDKTGIITIDEIVYTNNFLGINEKAGPGIIIGYKDFTGCSYSRNLYDNRMVRVNGDDGFDTWELISVNTAGVGYTIRWGSGPWTAIAAFRSAADDAVQVLDRVHGDSNMIWIPYDEPSS